MGKKFLLVLGSILCSLVLSLEVWASTYVVVAPTKLLMKPKRRVALLYLKPGTEVEEVQRGETWIKVRTKGGVEGWVHASKVKLIEESTGKDVEGGLCTTSEVKSLVGRGFNVGGNVTIGTNGTVSRSLVFPSVGVGGVGSLQGEQEGVIKKEDVSNIVYVKPNKTAMVEMSSLDINRVYCDGEITDVVFSEEKGVRVKIVKNNAFVKFVVKRIEDQEIPTNKPADLFFVCNEQVYSIIAIPKRIPSTFVYLESKDKKIQEVVERVKELPYEKRLLEIIKAIYVNKYEPNFQVVNVNKEFYLFKDVKVVLEKVIDIEGEGLRAKVFRLETNFDSSVQYVEVKEKDFVRKELTTIPLAVSLDKAKLQGKDKATLIILEKRVVGE
jgi:conjugal transfer pilus assembly protein TraK